MTRTPIPEDPQRATMKQDFIDEALTQELADSANAEGVAPNFSLGDLYAYAQGKPTRNALGIERALASHPGMRATFRRIVTEMAPYQSGEALAASDGGPISRKGPGFSLRFQPAQANPGHTYLIIELSDETKSTRNILHVFDEDNASRQLSLTPPRRGVIQVLLSDDDPVLKLLGDPKTEVMIG